MKNENENEIISKIIPYVIILVIGLVIGGFLNSSKDNSQEVISNDEILALEYTCSMHPEIASTVKEKCPLCGMSLILKNNTKEILNNNQFKLSENALALANVNTMIIGSIMPKENIVTVSGLLTTNDKTDAIQTTLFDGRIEDLNVNLIGDYFEKGQQIGLIYSPELYAAQDKLLTSATYKDSHKKLFDAARNTLGLWKLNDNQIEQLLKSGKPLSYFPLYADVSGTVIEAYAKVGNYYSQGDPLFKVSKLDDLWAVFDLYENQVNSLEIGQKIKIKINDATEKIIYGNIDFIEPILHPIKRSGKVRATINNNNGKLMPGMFIQGEVAVNINTENIIIPKSSILWTGKRSIVYIKADSDEQIFEMREIILGNKINDNYEVLNGLFPGERMVVNGVFTIDAAAQLHGKPSMMNNRPIDLKFHD